MSDKLKEFKAVTNEALINHFAKRGNYATDDWTMNRTVISLPTNDYVRTYGDEQLDEFDPANIVVKQAREAGGTVYVTFEVIRGERKYTFEFTDQTTLMNIIMKAVIAA